MSQPQQPLFQYQRHATDEKRGRCLVATDEIQKAQLIFLERPVIAMQSIGNSHEGVLVCSYCMAFCGRPKQALDVASDPTLLLEISTTNGDTGNGDDDDDDDDDDDVDDGLNNNVIDDKHTIHCCRHKCGHIYCSRECQQDDWEWGGHQELCTGTIPDPDDQDEEETSKNQDQDQDQDQQELDTNNSIGKDEEIPSMHPLLQFKLHARETNEIFLLVATWLVRILKQNLPYYDDDSMHDHPYTDFQMNAWWDVKTTELLAQPGDRTSNIAEAKSLELILKELCKESHSFLSQALLLNRQDAVDCSFINSPWLTPLGMARLIGSLEQNCLGIRRKHALQHDVMYDAVLRQGLHTELIQCLEEAGAIGDEDEFEADDDGKCDDDKYNDDECNDTKCYNTKCDDDKCDDDKCEDAKCDDDECGCDDVNIDVHNHDHDHDHNHNHNDKDDVDDDVDKNDGVDDDAGVNKGVISAYSHDEIADFFGSLKTDDEWYDFIRPLDGISHYSIATKMNHSCDPNVILVYETRGWGRDHPLVAYCVALRDIAPGEELTISYITSEDPYEKRQADLANYGFVCTCSKCNRENEDTIEGGKASTEGIDEDDLFGDDDDDDDDGQNVEGDYDDKQLSGEDNLQNVAERLEPILNNLNQASIPIAYLAPALNYVIKEASSLLQVMRSTKGAENETIIVDFLEQNIHALRDRDFASCRIVGSGLELLLYNQLESNGSWLSAMYRSSYWFASITASIGYANEGSFLVSMKYLDKATILGLDRNKLELYFGYVELFASQMAVGPCPIAVDCKISDFQSPELKELVANIALSKPIQYPANEVIISNVSNMNEVLASNACVIRGVASEWPALKKWRAMDVVAREFGHRLVPIEIGSMTNGMEEAVVTFRQFVSKYLSTSATKDCWTLDDAVMDKNSVAYIAQHPLLDQIPALCSDIDMNPCGVQPTNINIWMGTGGTRTPLHFDSYDNLLVQLVGAKYVRLYDRECSQQLYVSKKDTSYGGQGNMSELDCEREDYERHPLAKDCNYKEVLLFPGDCLFIPARQWHYVRSLSTSVSVNYWF
jgi:hypothetical protein